MWKRFWKRICDTWGAIRQLLAIRSLLEIFGWKAALVTIAVSTVFGLWVHFQRLPLFAQFLVIFGVAAIAVILLVFIRVYRNVAAADSQAEVPAQSVLTNSDGPEVVVDYNYSEDSSDNHDPNRPLVLRNISAQVQAYNIEVLPLQTEVGTVKWRPDLIPYIEAQGRRNVFADVHDAGGSPLLGQMLPHFLFKTYKDKSTDELFGTKSFELHVRYKGMDSSKTFETVCELKFRPWKRRTEIGRTERRIVAAFDARQTAREGDSQNERPSTSEQVKTCEIRFEYLPGNLLDNGWVRAYPKDTDVRPKATIAPDAPIAGSIIIDAPDGHAYEYQLPINVRLSDRLKFAAKYSSTTMIFTWVELSSIDGTQTVNKLIKYIVGKESPHPTKGWEKLEYTLPIVGEPMINQWRRFDIDLPEAVARTWGRDGLIFKGITGFRLRGSLGISPIEFYESRTRRDSM